MDWGTVLAPTTTLSYPAREVFRFNDDLQSTHPLFLAIEYGSSSTTEAMGLRLTIGKGVDAGGAITGVLISGLLVGMTTGSSSSAHSTTVLTHAVATCPGRACLVFVPSVNANIVASPVFMIERSRDNEGNATGAGLAVTVMRSANGVQSVSYPPNPFFAIAYDSAQYNDGPVPVVLPYRVAGVVAGGSSSLATGVIAPVLPWLAFAPGVAPWQPLAGITYMPGDAVAGAVISVRILGRDRPYRVITLDGHHGWGVSLRPVIAAGDATLTATRQAGLMILWED